MTTPKNERPLALRVVKGGFVPANEETRRILRRTNLKTGNLVLADMSLPRRPGFYRLAHKFAQACKDNIDEFQGLTEHQVLKRLQSDTGLGCTTVSVPVNRIWAQAAKQILQTLGPEAQDTLQIVEEMLDGEMVTAYIPQSLAFGNMPEEEFRSIFQGFCQHIADRYWPTLDSNQVAELAHFMPELEI